MINFPRMIVILLSILPYIGITKIPNLTFIGCQNIRLESYCMVVTTSAHALSWRYNVHVCAVTVLYHTHYINSYIRRHFIIDGYGIFTSLRCNISYPCTMYAYNVLISISSPSVSTLYSITSFFDPIMTKFPTK